MNDPTDLHSPLAAIPSANQAALSMRERPSLGYLNLRGQPEQSAFTEAVRAASGIDLPLTSNTLARIDGLTVLWLAPNEWLLVTEPGVQDMLQPAIRKTFGNLFAAVTDVSSGYTTIEIAGAEARHLLARGCTLDLHPRMFAPGQCAQTLVAKAGVTLYQAADTSIFNVIVRRSFADYLWRWLDVAARDMRAGAR